MAIFLLSSLISEDSESYSKSSIAFSVALLMTVSFFAFFASSVPQGDANSPISMPMGTDIYNGSILIAPDGNIVASNPGFPISHTLGSNAYTFTGNINGTLTIERSSAQINGAGFSIYNSTSSTFYVLNISNADSISVNNLSVNASGSSYSSIGVLLYNTTDDNLVNMTISASLSGIMASNLTSYVNITESKVTPELSTGFYIAGIVLGAYEPHSFGYPMGTNSTSHISMIGDTLVARDYGPALIEVSNNTLLKSSVIDASNLSTFGAAVLMGGNDLSVIGNVFHLYNALAVNITSIYYNQLSSLNISGNTINDTLGAAVNNPIVYANGNVTISKNSMRLNAAGINKVLGIVTNGEKATVSDNYLNITNGSSSSVFYYISLNSTVVHVTGNDLTGDSASEFIGISTLTNYPLYYLNDSVISNNSISFNATIGGYGIDIGAIFSVNNVVFANNTIDIYNLLWTGSNSESGNANGIEASGSNESFTGNNITLSGGADNFGMYLDVTGMNTGYGKNVTVSNNKLNISDQQYSDGIVINNGNGPTYSHGIEVQSNQVEVNSPDSYSGIVIGNLNYTGILDNTVSSSSVTYGSSYFVIARDSNNIKVDSNTLSGPISGTGATAAIQLLHVSYSLIGNNTVYKTPYGTFLSSSNNVTIEGNYYTNTSQEAIGFDMADNVTVYHNDFVNYTTISAVGIKNVRFNLSYPIGGNYWSNLQGSFVDQKSGPNQNAAGSDGINDSKYSPAAGVTDYYPLVHKWVRPQAVFHAPSGITGTIWKVTFNGITKQSTNDTITFNIVNGTYQKYNFEYYNSSLYYTSTSSGNSSYSGSGLSINVPYLHYSYITGHLNLSNFTVSINGKQVTVSNGIFNLTVIAGSYDVVIASTGYLTFNHTYNLTPGETLNVSPVLGLNHPKNVPIPILAYAVAAVAVIAVAGGKAFYFRGRSKN